MDELRLGWHGVTQDVVVCWIRSAMVITIAILILVQIIGQLYSDMSKIQVLYYSKYSPVKGATLFVFGKHISRAPTRDFHIASSGYAICQHQF